MSSAFLFQRHIEAASPDAAGDAGFGLLFIIGALDTATRMGYLLFLPFLLHARGGTEAVLGLGLALLFTGGALGKAACGWLGQRLGVVWSVITTEAATTLLMMATLILPLVPMLAVLPVLGIVLNGTSWVSDLLDLVLQRFLPQRPGADNTQDD
jgi:FSR family fosmidomycin resistance protein-like MFS transporter